MTNVTQRGFNRKIRQTPYEAVKFWKTSLLAKSFDEQEAKQKWRHYPAVVCIVYYFSKPKL
jgi:hypothetical protein